jgi:hypothetical protein
MRPPPSSNPTMLMASGGPQGWAWQHFHTDKTKYKSNNTHLNAWCSGDDNSDSPLSNTPSTVPRCRIICYFGHQELIPLTNLFHFQKLGCSDETPSGRKEKDLDYY